MMMHGDLRRIRQTVPVAGRRDRADGGGGAVMRRRSVSWVFVDNPA